jgi:Lon protease-like protein
MPLFPLQGAVLYPRGVLALNVFEPRYLNMVDDALASERLIGVIQPATGEENEPVPQLADVGTAGRITSFTEADDGRYNIVLEGQARFRVLRELEVTTPFRQVEGELIADPEVEALSAIERAGFETEAREFADRQGYAVDWDAVSHLDDQALINGVSQIAPFDAAAKQALLEAPNIAARCELLVQLMQFFGHGDPDEGRVTLQ